MQALMVMILVLNAERYTTRMNCFRFLAEAWKVKAVAAVPQSSHSMLWQEWLVYKPMRHL